MANFCCCAKLVNKKKFGQSCHFDGNLMAQLEKFQKIKLINVLPWEDQRQDSQPDFSKLIGNTRQMSCICCSSAKLSATKSHSSNLGAESEIN